MLTKLNTGLRTSLLSKLTAPTAYDKVLIRFSDAKVIIFSDNKAIAFKE